MSIVTIHYTRIPDRTTVFTQQLVERSDRCTVTLMERTPLREPVRAAGREILANGSPVVWFTFPDEWHDIGAFHTPDGILTGWYANIITPVRFRTPEEWETTDLFLDVWLGADGTVLLLDEDELADAQAAGDVDPQLATAARSEASRLLHLARRGNWPPEAVRKWPLERARAEV